MSRQKQDRKATEVAVKAPVTDHQLTDGLVNVVTKLGLGGGNTISESRYATLRRLTRGELESMYRTSWVVGRVIDSVAKDMTRAGVLITGSSRPQDAKRLTNSMTRIGVWRGILNGLRWGRLYGGAIAFINIDGQEPYTPLNPATVGVGQFKGIRIFDRHQVQPNVERLVQDGLHEGTPTSYQILAGPSNDLRMNGVKVHHSRVVRFLGHELPPFQSVLEQGWSAPIVERMFDRLVAFDAGTMGAANLLSKAYLRVVGVNNLRDILLAGGKAEESVMTMFSMMAVLQHTEGITLLDKEDTFEAHSYTYAGLDDILLSFGQQLSGASGIPLVKLFGQAPKGLNATGESDLQMYYDDISATQENDLRDGLTTILDIMHRSVLGTPPPEDFDFDFNPLWQMSATERVANAQALATNVGEQYDRGLITRATALLELKQASEENGVWSNITDEMIAAALAEDEPVPDPAEALATIEAFAAGTETAAEADPLAAIEAFVQGAEPTDDQGDPLAAIEAFTAGTEEPTPDAAPAEPDEKPGLLARIQKFVMG